MQRVKGFTLLELMTCLSIIFIVSSFAVPNIRDLIENYRAKSIIYRIGHHLNLARNEAVTRNVYITLCASLDGQICSKGRNWTDKYLLVFKDDNIDGQHQGTEEVIESTYIDYRKGLLYWRAFQNKSYLQWTPNGYTNYQNGNFLYCPKSRKNKHAKIIVTNVTGRIYFGGDKNRDGILEGADNKNISCDF